MTIGGNATVQSGNALVATLVPWQPVEVPVRGRFPSFDINSTALVVVGTSCAFIEPTSSCSIGRGWIYMPPIHETTHRTYVRAADADAEHRRDAPPELWAWRLVQYDGPSLSLLHPSSAGGISAGKTAPRVQDQDPRLPDLFTLDATDSDGVVSQPTPSSSTGGKTASQVQDQASLFSLDDNENGGGERNRLARRDLTSVVQPIHWVKYFVGRAMLPTAGKQ